ncbi:MFS transporter [Streptomyces sp. NPDC096153]|uniref:MFS transporter n=1 Tax=Streptomyces sp. NPDC096153 TaxID=3155548 RepID=UPI003323D712
MIPVLPKATWGLLAVIGLSSLGTGMTLPFEMIYLHQVRGLSLSHAGFTLALSTVAAFAVNYVGGVLCDRIGARPTMALGLVVEGCGVLALAHVTEFWHALAAVVVTGVGGGVAWPAQDAMIATTVPEGCRSAAFGIRHAALNAGLGVGGLLAAVITQGGGVASYVTLFFLDAATFLLAAVALWFLNQGPADARPAPEAPGAATGGGYRAVLRDATFLRLWLIVFLLAAAGYAQLYSAVPAYLLGEGFGPGIMGVFSAVNAVTVVIAQIAVLKFIDGRRRTSLITVLCALWSTAWIALVIAASSPGPAAVALVITAAAVFAVGETLLPTSAPVLVNAIAPEAMRGRYNGLTASAFTLGGFVGTAEAGLVLSGGHGRLHFVACIGIFAIVAVLALHTGKRLPSTVNLGQTTLDTAKGLSSC